MGRTAGSFKRSAPKFKPQPTVLVICEDQKSSKIYFEEASRHYRAHTQVEFCHVGKTDPLGIVTAAVGRSKKFDHVYCVIDRDTHHLPNFEAALQMGSRSGQKVTVLTSYPCFEFWLLLHFGYSRAGFMSSPGVSAAEKVTQSLKTKPAMSTYAKGRIEGLFEQLLQHLPAAVTNAAKTLREAHIDNEMNPSSPLHELIAKLQELGKPIPLG